MNRITSLLKLVFIISASSVEAQTTLLWSESAGTSASSQKSFVATDLIGNIYMASTVNGTYGLDWKISSWRPDSVSRWTYTYNGAGNEDDIPAAIVVDSAFNIYVAGTIKASGSNDIRVIKLDSAGNLKWGTNYNRTGSAHDVGTGLAVVGDKLWVSGHSQQSTSNYDYTLLKYDTAGTLSWSRHRDGSASGDDYSTALAVRSNGDAYVTGSGVVSGTGSVRDVMTVRYTTDGTLSWTNYYGGTSGQHDYGNDVKLDASGNILITGQTFIGANNSDLILIKYSSGGSQSWVATYSGASKKHDAGNALVIGSDGYYYVTGFMQTSAGTNNYVTVRYNSSGTVNWAQTYDGPGASDDEACAIIEDGSDIVITGKSTGSGTGLDVCTISMVKSSGSVNWTMRINESGSSGDYGMSLCRDEMGNVIVTGNALIPSSYGNTCYKFNQAAKNAAAILEHLHMLAWGVLEITDDTASKRVYYDMAFLLVDSVYQVPLYRYLLKCDQQSISTRTTIRQGIATHNSLSSSYPWEKILDARFYHGKERWVPRIFVPGFQVFSRSEFISDTLAVAYSHNDGDYPITSLPSGTLDESDVLSLPTLTLITSPAPWWSKLKPHLAYCYAENVSWSGYPCSVCGGFAAVDGLPTGTSCANNSMNYEVGIRIGYNYNTNCLSASGDEECLTVYDYPSGIGILGYYAVLSQLDGAPFYRLMGSANYQRIQKVSLGCFDVNRQAYGYSMSLCQEETFFNSLCGTYTENYAVAYGGIFSVSRPGTNLRPVYFTLPYCPGLRYWGFPDMNIVYGADHPGSLCLNGTDEEIAEDYFNGGSPITNSTEYVFSLTQNQTADIIMTTDYSTISSFWTDNAIVVGFNNNSSLVRPGNFATFYAATSPTPCNLSNYNYNTTAVCSLEVLSDGTYEIRKDFFGTSVTYPAGTAFLIHVVAKYSNGEEINECQTVTTVTSSPVSVNANVCVEIRGGINDYSATVTNYKVDVYLLN